MGKQSRHGGARLGRARHRTGIASAVPHRPGLGFVGQGTAASGIARHRQFPTKHLSSATPKGGGFRAAISMTTKTLPIASLVEDFTIYPRHDVDSTHVSDLARAIKAGVNIPPPICEAGSLRIVDGFHRVHAWRRACGGEAQIKVELRHYESGVELLKDAIALNASHGRRLDQQDRTRCVLLLKSHGVELDTIAIVLHTTTGRVEQLMARVVVVDGEQLPAKPIVFPVGDQSRKLTASQYAVARSSSGWRPRQTITQLINEINGNVINLQDGALVRLLWALHAAIEAKVPRHGNIPPQ